MPERNDCSYRAGINPGPPRAYLASILARLRQRVGQWWQRNGRTGQRRIRDNALLSEVVGWLPEHYGAEVKRIVMEHSERPNGWWR